MEDLNTELESKILDAASDPYAKIKQLAKEADIPENVIQRILKRYRGKDLAVVSELKTVKTKELTDLIEDRMHTALEYMDDFAMARATAKDLAIIVGILGDKRQLLKGEPTHIISRQERMQLTELMPLVLKEMERRGITSLVDAEYIEVTQGDKKLTHTNRKNVAENTAMKKAVEKNEP